MENSLQKQTNKFLNPLWKAKSEETLGLSKDIISGKAQLAHIELGLKIQDTFQKPTIRSVFKDEAGIIGFSVVNVLINRFMDSFGFSKKMEETQIESLTVDMLENFEYESLHDVILFLKMARSGKLGTTQRGVDSNLIFGEWFPKYLELKAELREQNYVTQKSEQNSISVSMEDVKKTYENISKKNYDSKVSEYVDRITEKFDRQMLEDLIVDWNKDPARKPYINLLKIKRKIV